MLPVDLERYLPAIPMPWAGSDLNFAPPIWQRSPGETEETPDLTREDF